MFNDSWGWISLVADRGFPAPVGEHFIKMKGRQIRSTSDRLFTSLIVFTVICNLKVFTVKCLEAVFLQLLCKKKRIICKKNKQTKNKTKTLTYHFFTISASKCKGPWANHMCFGGSWLKALCYTIEDYLVIYNCVTTNNKKMNTIHICMQWLNTI